MPAPAINLVCTRCTDGNHIALQRWYADHVHLLLLAPELQGAALYRCEQLLHGMPPDYFCVYAFAHLEDFAAFERGSGKAQATALTNAAAGRASVEIVQRTQYTRWLHRQWAASSHAIGAVWQLVICLEAEGGWPLEAQRWLADQLQALRSSSPLIEAQMFSSEGAGHPSFMVLDFAGCDAGEMWQMLQAQLSAPALYGQALQLKTIWAASASPLQTWLR